MSIKIKTTKIVDKDGTEGRTIDSIEGVLSFEQLPGEYIDFRNLPSGWGGCDMYIGKFISEKTFQENLKSIKLCGDKLHEINQKIAERRKNWVGEETFII